MKIAVFGQAPPQPADTDKLKALLKSFFQNGFTIFLESSFYKTIVSLGAPAEWFVEFRDDCLADLDLFISIGGDGTLLRSMAKVRNSGVPIIGINAGRLGFLSTIQMEDTSVLLENILKNELQVSSRAILELAQPELEFPYALNEITVIRKDTVSMITVETFLDSEYLSTYWADGLIICTPTGSTGYSMSCGGPIIEPASNVLAITPIAPHNLSARPFVISDAKTIKLNVKGRSKDHLISLDTRIFSVENQTEIIIKKADFKLKLIELKTEGFIKTLRKKLLWGEDRRN